MSDEYIKILKRISLLSYTQIQWITVFVVLFVDFMWIYFSSIKFFCDVSDIIYFLPFFILLILIYFIYTKLRPDPYITIVMHFMLFFISFSNLMLILSYLAATTNQPFVDSTLAALDSYMGYSSRDLVLMFRSHQWLYNFFSFIYNFYYFEIYIVLLYFVFLGKFVYIERFLMQCIIGLSLTILIGGLFPAEGPYVWYDYPASPRLQSALNHLYELRSNIVDIRKADGIVTIPSFHTAMALIYTYTFRHEKKIILIPILILNLLIVFSCLPIGQHYLTDILAGIIVFGVTLVIEQLIFWGVTKPNKLKWSPFQKKINQQNRKKIKEELC